MPEDAREATLKRLLDAHRRLAARPAGRLVLHADDAALLAASRRRRRRVRRHGRAVEVQASRRPKLLELEQELIDKADIVFTGGRASTRRRRTATTTSIASRRRSTARISARRARASSTPPTRKTCPRPRLGFYGVIDERFDTELLGQGRGDASRLVVRHGRPGREDRGRGPAAPAQHPLPRLQDLRRSCRPICRAGTSR